MLRTIDLAMIGLLIAGAGWTFLIKHNAEEARYRVRQLERELSHEGEEIDLLKADWALLSSPARLQQLVAHFNHELQLNVLEPRQIVKMDALPPRRSAIDPARLSSPAGEAASLDADNNAIVTGALPEVKQPYPGDASAASEKPAPVPIARPEKPKSDAAKKPVAKTASVTPKPLQAPRAEKAVAKPKPKAVEQQSPDPLAGVVARAEAEMEDEFDTSPDSAGNDGQ